MNDATPVPLPEAPASEGRRLDATRPLPQAGVCVSNAPPPLQEDRNEDRDGVTTILKIIFVHKLFPVTGTDRAVPFAWCR